MFDIVKTTGKIVIQKRDVSGFNTIYLEDKIDLYITQGSTFKVEVEAGSNLQSLIKTELDGETLKIHNNNKQNWVRGYKHRIKVYISAPYFKYIDNHGVGTIESINTITQNEVSIRGGNTGDLKIKVNCNEINCRSHGNGNIYVSGFTKRLVGDFNGTNFLYARDLEIAEFVYINSNSIGSSYINSPNNGPMDIRLNKDGNVYYKGNPTYIDLSRIGKGNLIKE